MRARPLLAVLASLCAACLNEPRLSGPGESCAYTAHCAPALFCLENHCTAHGSIPNAAPPRSALDAAPDASPPRRRRLSAPEPTPIPLQATGWQIVSSRTPRAAAKIVDRLVNSNSAAFTKSCAITEPITVTFTYRFVRAQYAVDDHGVLAATPTEPATPSQHRCLLEALTQQSLVGRMNLGQRPWTLQARFTPQQQESQP